MKPRIGVLLERRPNGDFNKNFPFEAMEAFYFDAIMACGGIPLGIANHPKDAENTVQHIDGLLVPGGFFNTPLEHYEEINAPEHPDNASYQRFYNDMAHIDATLSQNKPVLAICGGMQNLNIHFGGTLYNGIREIVQDVMPHTGIANNKPAHEITIEPNTHLMSLANMESAIVNSHHNEALAKIGKGLVVSATAQDGVTEAIEHPDYKFCMGVQWHPEYFYAKEGLHRNLFESFIDACK